jgi:Tfp pilus assembly protein PilF/peroxiredoxin
VRLSGADGNRDAVGARVTVEAGTTRRSRVVQLGSGFLSQHGKELVFGLGGYQGTVALTVTWPSGRTQTFAGVGIDQRVSIREGRGALRAEPFALAAALPEAAAPAAVAPPPGVPSAGWLYEPFPAPDIRLRDITGQDRTLSELRGRPALLLFWSAAAPAAAAALRDLAAARDALEAAGVTVLALALDGPAEEATVRTAAEGVRLPVLVATDEVASTYGIVHRYLFDRREDMRLPTAFLLDARGEIVRFYREPSAAQVLADVPRIEAPPGERLTRALPFPGTLYAKPSARGYFQYGLELSEQGFDAAALPAFERVARSDPSALTFFNLGTLYMKGGNAAGARAAFERALELQPGNADASNSLGALLAQSGEVPAAIERFRAALAARPGFADALNNLGFALFQTGQPAAAYELYQRALAARPGFAEALNNLGIFHGRQGDLERAQGYFEQAVAQRPAYGEAANNLALVLAARGDAAAAIERLKRTLEAVPEFEMTYVTLGRLYLKAGQRAEAAQVLERLLQRNPRHPLALDLLRQLRSSG